MAYVPKILLFLIVKSTVATLCFQTEKHKTYVSNTKNDISLKNSFTIKNCNHNNSERSQRVSVKIHVIDPLYSGHRDELIIPRNTYVKLKRNA